jgi:uncharacterized protein
VNLQANLTARPVGLAKAHKIELAGLTFVPDLSGALYEPASQSLIVADLHLEQGTSLARRGIAVPPFDTAITMSVLENLIASLTIQSIYFLGDSFHDDGALVRLDETIMLRLQAITQQHQCVWIDGNHDAMDKVILGGDRVAEIKIGDIVLRHEPQKLQPTEFEIAGHLHPGAAIAQRGSLVRGKCFVSDYKRIILPAFGAYTGGFSIHAKPFGGLFDRDTAKVHLLARKGLHAFPFSRTC